MGKLESLHFAKLNYVNKITMCILVMPEGPKGLGTVKLINENLRNEKKFNRGSSAAVAGIMFSFFFVRQTPILRNYYR